MEILLGAAKAFGLNLSVKSAISPKFGEFLDPYRKLPENKRAHFNQFVANVQSGMTMEDAERRYLVAIDIPEDETDPA